MTDSLNHHQLSRNTDSHKTKFEATTICKTKNHLLSVVSKKLEVHVMECAKQTKKISLCSTRANNIYDAEDAAHINSQYSRTESQATQNSFLGSRDNNCGIIGGEACEENEDSDAAFVHFEHFHKECEKINSLTSTYNLHVNKLKRLRSNNSANALHNELVPLPYEVNVYNNGSLRDNSSITTPLSPALTEEEELFIDQVASNDTADDFGEAELVSNNKHIGRSTDNDCELRRYRRRLFTKAAPRHLQTISLQLEFGVNKLLMCNLSCEVRSNLLNQLYEYVHMCFCSREGKLQHSNNVSCAIVNNVPFWVAAFAHTRNIYAQLTTFSSEWYNKINNTQNIKGEFNCSTAKQATEPNIFFSSANTIDWPAWVPDQLTSIRILSALWATACLLAADIAKSLSYVSDDDITRASDSTCEPFDVEHTVSSYTTLSTFMHSVFGRHESEKLIRYFCEHLPFTVEACTLLEDTDLRDGYKRGHCHETDLRRLWKSIHRLQYNRVHIDDNHGNNNNDSKKDSFHSKRVHRNEMYAKHHFYKNKYDNVNLHHVPESFSVLSPSQHQQQCFSAFHEKREESTSNSYIYPSLLDCIHYLSLNFINTYLPSLANHLHSFCISFSRVISNLCSYGHNEKETVVKSNEIITKTTTMTVNTFSKCANVNNIVYDAVKQLSEQSNTHEKRKCVRQKGKEFHGKVECEVRGEGFSERCGNKDMETLNTCLSKNNNNFNNEWTIDAIKQDKMLILLVEALTFFTRWDMWMEEGWSTTSVHFASRTNKNRDISKANNTLIYDQMNCCSEQCELQEEEEQKELSNKRKHNRVQYIEFHDQMLNVYQKEQVQSDECKFDKIACNYTLEQTSQLQMSITLNSMAVETFRFVMHIPWAHTIDQDNLHSCNHCNTNMHSDFNIINNNSCLDCTDDTCTDDESTITKNNKLVSSNILLYRTRWLKEMTYLLELLPLIYTHYLTRKDVESILLRTLEELSHISTSKSISSKQKNHKCQNAVKEHFTKMHYLFVVVCWFVFGKYTEINNNMLYERQRKEQNRQKDLEAYNVRQHVDMQNKNNDNVLKISKSNKQDQYNTECNSEHCSGYDNNNINTIDNLRKKAEMCWRNWLLPFFQICETYYDDSYAYDTSNANMEESNNNNNKNNNKNKSNDNKECYVCEHKIALPLAVCVESEKQSQEMNTSTGMELYTSNASSSLSQSVHESIVCHAIEITQCVLHSLNTLRHFIHRQSSKGKFVEKKSGNRRQDCASRKETSKNPWSFVHLGEEDSITSYTKEYNAVASSNCSASTQSAHTCFSYTSISSFATNSTITNQSIHSHEHAMCMNKIVTEHKNDKNEEENKCTDRANYYNKIYSINASINNNNNNESNNNNRLCMEAEKLPNTYKHVGNTKYRLTGSQSTGKECAFCNDVLSEKEWEKTVQYCSLNNIHHRSLREIRRMLVSLLEYLHFILSLCQQQTLESNEENFQELTPFRPTNLWSMDRHVCYIEPSIHHCRKCDTLFSQNEFTSSSSSYSSSQHSSTQEQSLEVSFSYSSFQSSTSTSSTLKRLESEKSSPLSSSDKMVARRLFSEASKNEEIEMQCRQFNDNKRDKKSNSEPFTVTNNKANINSDENEDEEGHTSRLHSDESILPSSQLCCYLSSDNE